MPLTLRAAVEYAQNNLPAVRAALAQSAANQAGVDLARTSFLPRTDILVSANRATRNNVFGLMLPQPVIPTMSVPVLGSNDAGSTWGSASGALFF
jgi:outer membrane protein TolC